MEDLGIFVHYRAVNFLHRLICPRWFVRCRQFCWAPNCFQQHVSLYFQNNQRCSVDAELIDGDDCAQNHLDSFVVTTEMYRQLFLKKKKTR